MILHLFLETLGISYMMTDTRMIQLLIMLIRIVTLLQLRMKGIIILYY